MDKTVKKKLKIVLWAFIIISIPVGFFIYSALLIDKAYKAFEEAIFSDKNKDIELALKRIDNAESFAFFDNNLVNKKVQLLYRKKEYRKALNAVKRKDAYIYKGLLYEHLNRSDSAAILYEKVIPELKKKWKKNRGNAYLAYEIERQIALFYTFLNQSESAKEYLNEIPKEYDPELRELLLHYDYYIENYISGGYKDYIEGETLLFGIDSISDMNMDSLFAANRFYFDSHSYSGNKHKYEIKKIFEQKAIGIGMNRIE
jgi:tetratricopeptide (TPR) repeat protein